MLNLAEQFRAEVVRQTIANTTFAAGWTVRRNEIVGQLGPPTSWTPARVVAIGRSLSPLFRLGAPAVGTGRTQSSLSGGGAVWECLVTYYLNLCYAGTDVIAVRKGSVPPAIKEALSVWHGPTRVAADVDCVLIHVPRMSEEAGVTTNVRGSVFDLVQRGFRELGVVVLACKTNWNDSIQTPMLWNLLYSMRRQGSPLPPGFSIGSGGNALDALAEFGYAFITVPSNNPAGYRPNGAPAERARTMAGGYFWGYPSVNAVCPAITEIFGRLAATARFPPPYRAGVATAAAANVPPGQIDISSFDLL